MSNDEFNKEMMELATMAEDVCEHIKRCDDKNVLEKLMEGIKK